MLAYKRKPAKAKSLKNCARFVKDQGLQPCRQGVPVAIGRGFVSPSDEPSIVYGFH